VSAGAALPGVVALGDSITCGRGDTMLGLHCRSWAQRLAESVDLPFHGLARDGAVVTDVRGEQVPRLQSAYALGAVYAGVNDVRAVDFDLDAFTRDLAVVVQHVADHAERVVLCTIPLDIGRPRAGAAKVGEANAVIRRLAAEHGCAVAALDDLRGRLLVLPDAVHPTALGQLEIADRAARALGLPRLPSQLVDVDRGPRSVARFAVTGLAPALARDWRRRLREHDGA
jgi:lysophospholipase L1-like esterase